MNSALIKQIIRLLFISYIFLGCVQKSATTTSSEIFQENLWKPIVLKVWKHTPAMSNRNANEEDVKKGTAVYHIEGDFENHKPYDIKLPKVAYLTDYEIKAKELVIIIQIEETPKGIVVGYRNLTGGNGAGLINEFEILDDKQIEKLIK